MIKKQFVKSRNITKVTFELAEVAVDNVQLLADFNKWQPVPFKKLKGNKWQLVQEVTPGQSYQFRYLLEQQGVHEFINDHAADAIIANDQGTENAVLNA